MRKIFCTLLILLGFSLFAQESTSAINTEVAGTVATTADSAASAKESSTSLDSVSATVGETQVADDQSKREALEEVEEKDLSQNYLAKSAAPVNAVTWTRDGKYFATSWNNSVILWNAGSNTIAAIYSNSFSGKSNPLANVMSLQFTSDGRYMLNVRDDNTIMIHGTGEDSETILITGTGKSIPDAVYAGDYRIILPLDGQNLYENYRLLGSGEQAVEQKMALSQVPWGLSTNPSGKKLLVSSEGGDILLVDTSSWETIKTYSCYTLSRIKPRLADDSIHFLVAESQTKLKVISLNDDAESYTLENRGGFSYVAEFSSDSSKVVAGTEDGYVKIYDIASGLEENYFKLMYGDTAKSLAFSPDDKYVIIGTEQGFIYRWVLSGEEFVPEETEENELKNALILSLGYGRVNSDYYLGRAILDIGYRNYFHLPFYWGCGGNIEAGLPGSEFPYTYYENGESLSSPFLYGVALGGVFGLVYYNKRFDLSVFSEAGAGATMRLLFNNSFQYTHVGKPYFGGYVDLSIGLQWKWIRALGGMQYDTNLKWIPKFQLGVAIPTSSFRNKKKIVPESRILMQGVPPGGGAE